MVGNEAGGQGGATGGRLSLADLLDGAERRPGRLAAQAPQGWMQGRTVYGGLSTALAFEAARTVEPDLAPLRSAQVAFVGPLAGRLDARAEVLRRGRSIAFVRAEVSGEAGLGLSAVFMFAAGRTSTLEHAAAAALAVPRPEDAPPAGRAMTGKLFAANLEYRHAQPRSETPEPRLLRWARLADREGLDATTELLAMADALPPAAMAMLATPAPVSSTTWLINLLTPRPQTRDGWWLLQAQADQARDGFSSQTMTVWNHDGEAVATGMQSVAIFG